jgi:hypothetical protein
MLSSVTCLSESVTAAPVCLDRGLQGNHKIHDKFLVSDCNLRHDSSLWGRYYSLSNI